MNSCSAERIDCQLEGSAAKSVEVDDAGQVVDVGGDVVVAVGLVGGRALGRRRCA